MVKKREIEISRRRFLKMELLSPAPGPIVWSEPENIFNGDSEDLNVIRPISPQGKVIQNLQHPFIRRLAYITQYSAEDNVQANPRTTEKGMKVNDWVHLETKPGMIGKQPHGNETILPDLGWKPLTENRGIRSMRLSRAAGTRRSSNSAGPAAE
jgi:hypothetical protein